MKVEEQLKHTGNQTTKDVYYRYSTHRVIVLPVREVND